MSTSYLLKLFLYLDSVKGNVDPTLIVRTCTRSFDQPNQRRKILPFTLIPFFYRVNNYWIHQDLYNVLKAIDEPFDSSRA